MKNKIYFKLNFFNIYYLQNNHLNYVESINSILNNYVLLYKNKLTIILNRFENYFNLHVSNVMIKALTIYDIENYINLSNKKENYKEYYELKSIIFSNRFLNEIKCTKLKDINSVIYTYKKFKIDGFNMDGFTNFYPLSLNPNITLDVIEKHVYQSWNWKILSENNNITPEFVVKYIDKPWNFKFLYNKFSCLSEVVKSKLINRFINNKINYPSIIIRDTNNNVILNGIQPNNTIIDRIYVDPPTINNIIDAHLIIPNITNNNFSLSSNYGFHI